jgi:hypothetical protein
MNRRRNAVAAWLDCHIRERRKIYIDNKMSEVRWGERKWNYKQDGR